MHRPVDIVSSHVASAMASESGWGLALVWVRAGSYNASVPARARTSIDADT